MLLKSKKLVFSELTYTAWKVSKYGVFSGPYFPVFGLNTEIYSVFSLNTGKSGPKKTPYLDTFHAVVEKKRSCILYIHEYSKYIFILI